jgi:hypothetical protein
MKSLQRRFEIVKAKCPDHSSYECYAKTIEGQNFTRPVINHWFGKLVEKDDYAGNERKWLIDQLCLLTKGVEEGVKQGQIAFSS